MNRARRDPPRRVIREFVNPILQTSAVTMGILGMARIPWETWARWFFPLVIVLIVLSLFLLIPPVLLNWGPFYSTKEGALRQS